MSEHVSRGASGSHLKTLVDSFLRDRSRGHTPELTFYRSLPTLRDAIDAAGMAKRPDGKRCDHQCRIPREVLEEVRDNLLARLKAIEAAASFDGLREIVDECRVPGFADLSVYDTALRLGAFLKLSPDKVYLHAGVRKGAKALGLDTSGRYLMRDQLPAELRRLRPEQVEDFLCIFKARLSGIGKSSEREWCGSTPSGGCSPRPRRRFC
jgi:hypothetical protein